jgi:hypothetical protein
MPRCPQNPLGFGVPSADLGHQAPALGRGELIRYRTGRLRVAPRGAKDQPASLGSSATRASGSKGRLVR